MEKIARRISPGVVIAALALFVVLGGSAWAVGTKTSALQRRCSAGGVRGFAEVRGTQVVPDRYATGAIGPKFNCAGGAVQVKRVDAGVYDVRFAGAGGSVGVANVGGGRGTAFATVTKSGGAFRVTIHQTVIQNPVDTTFELVVV